MSKQETQVLSDSVKDLVARIKEQKAITVENNGTVVVTEKLMEKFLPDGLTMDTVKQVDTFKRDFYAAAVDVTGQGFVKAAAAGKVPLSKNSKGEEITRLEATIPLYGNERLELTYTHETTRPNLQAEPNKDGTRPTYQSYGELDVTLKSPISNKKGGDLKKSLLNIKAAAEAAAAKK